MPKSLTLGNGEMLIGLDARGQVQDLHFPYVGLENQIAISQIHHVGVWVEGHIHWLADPAWQVEVTCESESFVGHTQAHNEELGITLSITDVVYNEKNVFIREVTVHNKWDHNREIKVFFGQQFQISESQRGDTAYFDPRCEALIHYKGRRAFLMNARVGTHTFDEYSTGLFHTEGKEGTFRDAEDGILSKNPIEHGTVDSMLGMTLEVPADGKRTLHYWLIAASSILEAQDLNSYVLRRGPQQLMETTTDFWHAWINKQNFTFYGLDESVSILFKKSLFTIRAHADNRGSIIASGDSDMLQHGRGGYNYMWPRDGARAALALDRAGDVNVAQRFFEFCNTVITREGYFMHKYRPDGALGSSWHPWVRDGKTELPIQEDGTALIIGALWNHYKRSRDLEFIESIYNSLIAKSADFLTGYMYHDTGLPYPSYDLWEEKHGISTFTSSATYQALMSAGKFAALLGKTESAERYYRAAQRVRQAILDHLYSKEIKMFRKLLRIKNGAFEYDNTLDMSSIFGVFNFGVLPPDDPRVKESINTIERELATSGNTGGITRYQDDNYFRISPSAPPNPWIVTTLWLAQYYILIAKTEKDMDRVKGCFSWVVKYAAPSGMLSEQLNPHTGERLGATPLVWSHSEFVITVLKYLEKLEELGICKVCYPIE